MIKRLLLLAVFSVSILGSVLGQKENNVKLRVYLRGLKSTKGTYFVRTKDNPRGKSVEFVIKDGKFNLQFRVEKPSIMYVNLKEEAVAKYMSPAKKSAYPTPLSFLVFIASPNSDISVNGKISDYVEGYPKGDKENNILSKLNRQIYPLMNKAMNIQYLLGDKTLSKSKVSRLNTAKKNIEKEIISVKKKFLRNNISSIIGLRTAAVLLDAGISLKEAPKFLSKIEDSYKGSSQYKVLMKRYEQLKGKASTAVGCIAPHIKTSNTKSGKEFDIKSLGNKYVLLDFWGTWCRYCVMALPDLKKFRDSHTDKFEVVSIAKEYGSLKTWRAFLKNHQYNWVQLYNGKGEFNYAKRFGVEGYPTFVLLSPKGKILMREVGEGKDFFKKLEKIINKK